MRTDPSEVVESSKALFKKHGFKKVTMTDIAEAARISRPTLYAIYADKEAVFAACIRAHIEEFRIESTREITNQKSSAAKFRALFRIYIVTPFSWYLDSKDAFDMLIHAHEYAPTEMSAYWREFEDGLASLVGQCSKNKGRAAREVAKVLVSFARDVRGSATSIKEIERLVDVAIGLALGK